jgi:hypothetical protein
VSAELRVAGVISDYPRPLRGPYPILCRIAENKRQRLCAAPFRAKLLICTECPVQHDVGLAFVRSDRPEIPPWCLYFSDVAGSA